MEKAKLKWTANLPSDKGKLNGKLEGELVCQFNPSELSITKLNDWSFTSNTDWNAPPLKFGGGQPASYDLTLFFDSYSKDRPKPLDVREDTNELLKLAMRGAGRAVSTTEKADPPSVIFIWGKITLFTAVVKSVTITYTMFDQDGTPIRAKAAVKFQQNDEKNNSDDYVQAQNPTSRTDPRRTRIVHAGQRLDQIAYEEYGDARFWRLLAESNQMDDPFHLTDGQILVIPQADVV
jgi:hypothetical protein